MRGAWGSGAVICASIGALIAAGFATGLLGDNELYRAVKKDPSWLAYLPPTDTSLDLAGFSLNSDNATRAWMRRVDVMDSSNNRVASLCFAESRRVLRYACPGSEFLGVSARDDMQLPAVSQIEPYKAVDWMVLLKKPAPDLADVREHFDD